MRFYHLHAKLNVTLLVLIWACNHFLFFLLNHKHYQWNLKVSSNHSLEYRVSHKFVLSIKLQHQRLKHNHKMLGNNNHHSKFLYLWLFYQLFKGSYTKEDSHPWNWIALTLVITWFHNLSKLLVLTYIYPPIR